MIYKNVDECVYIAEILTTMNVTIPWWWHPLLKDYNCSYQLQVVDSFPKTYELLGK